MIQQIFTIYDSAAGAYLPPFYMPQRGMALRTFGDCINDSKHQFSLHPDHYTLFMVGTFDDNTGEAITTTPESIGNGIEFINKEPDLEQEIRIMSNPDQGELLQKLNSEDHPA